MPELTVIAAAYYPSDACCHILKESCRRLNVPLHLYGIGKKWPWWLDGKVTRLKQELQSVTSEYVMFTDSSDVMLIKDAGEIVSRFTALDTPLLVSAEKGNWPDPSLAYPPSDSEWKYVNSGGILGTRQSLLDVLDAMQALSQQPHKYSSYDQWLLAQLYLNGYDLTLDTACRIFQTMHGLTTLEALHIDACVLHYNAHTPGMPAAFRQHFLRPTPPPPSPSGPKVARAEQIPGWMERHELEWLGRTAAHYKCIVEIGSHVGRSTRALADNTTGIVIAIDDWQGPRDTYIADRQGFYEQFCDNMRDLGARVQAIRADHAAVPNGFTPDMVFIDGSHEYADVARDIRTWKARMKNGGLLCGHDASHPGVWQAIKELVPLFRVASGTTIWYCHLEKESPQCPPLADTN